MQTSLINFRDSFSSTAQDPLVPGSILTRQELSSVTTQDIERIKFLTTSSVTSVTAKALGEIFAYEGFDPQVVYRHFAHVKQTKAIDDQELTRDLLMLLTLHHVKGNLTAKNVQSLELRARNLTVNLINKWNILLKVGNNKQTGITLPRIGAAFPYPLACIAKEVDKNFIGPFGSSNLPSYMRTSSFPALIPSAGDTTILLLVAYTSFSSDMSVNISGRSYLKMTEDEKKAVWENQWKYTQTIYNSNIYDQNNRRKHLRDLGVGTVEVFNKLKLCLKYASIIPNISESAYVAEFAVPSAPI